MRREVWIAAGILALLLLALGWLATRGGESPAPVAEPTTKSSHGSNPGNGAAMASLPSEPGEPGTIPSPELPPVFRGPCTVRGMVVDPEGKPVEGAMIEVLMEAVAPGDRETRIATPRDPTWQEEDHSSGADGVFEFELDSHCPRSLAAVTGDDRRGDCRGYFPREGPVECMLVVKPTWDLHGTVVDLDGVPVSGMRVSATPDANYQLYKEFVDPGSTDVEMDHLALDIHGIWSQRGFSDEDGRFTIERLGATDWVLLVEETAYQRATVAVSEADLCGGVEVRLVVEPKECWSVQVVDDEGRPVAGARVLVVPVMGRAERESSDSTTDESGTVEVCEVSSRNAHLMVQSADHTLADADNFEGTDPLLVQVHGAGAVVGTLAVHVHETSSSMMVRATDCVRPDGSTCCPTLFSGACATGPFRIDHVPAGEMTLSLGCFKGYRDGKRHNARVERQVTVRVGEVTDVGEVSFIEPEYSATPP